MEKLFGFKNKYFQNQTVKKISDLLFKFFSSDIYIITLFIIAILNWKFKIIWLVFSFSLIFILLIYLFNISKIRIIPIAISLIISLRLSSGDNYQLPIIIGSIILILLLIFDFFKRKMVFNNGILVGMILILISQVFSLINTPVILSSIQGIGMWIFYIVIFVYMLNMEYLKDNKDIGRYYLAKTFVYLSIAIFIEIILYYLENGIGQNAISFYAGDNINFGWAYPRDVAMIYLLVLPIIIFYFYLNQKKFYFLLIIAINLVMLHLMLSRGAYLALILLVIPLILKIINDVKHKTKLVITLIYSLIIVLLVLILVAIPTGYVKEFFDFLSSKGPSVEERELMTSIGLNVFERYPLFGGGVNSSKFYLSIALDNRFYENFIIQTLANTGIVGFISLSYYIVQIMRYSVIKNKYNSYILFIVIAMIIQGLMETTLYQPLIMILFSFIFPLLATKEEEMFESKGD